MSVLSPAAEIRPASRRTAWWIPAVAVWLVIITTGTVALARYKETAGAPMHPAAETWPAGSKLPRDAERFTLVLFAHPMCPCTRATIGELARLQPVIADKTRIEVVFVRPEGTPDEWAKSDLWTRAREIPGVEVLEDREGVEAKRFGAETSGQAALFDASGALVFRGGITPARGHEGDSAGQDRIRAIIAGEDPELRESPVFGCALEAQPGEQGR
jgi:hypothetical protein